MSPSKDEGVLYLKYCCLTSACYLCSSTGNNRLERVGWSWNVQGPNAGVTVGFAGFSTLCFEPARSRAIGPSSTDARGLGLR